MEKNENFPLKVYFPLLFSCSIFFWLNYYHTSQQGIWENRYVVLSRNLLEGFNYSYDNNIIATYPMWGYPILTSIVSHFTKPENIIFFQFSLLLITLFLILKTFEFAKPKTQFEIIIVCGVMVFYSMVLSVKWPAAIIAFLLFIFALFHQKQKYFFALASIGLAYNFRSEAIIFFFLYALYLFIKEKKITPTALALILLLPWPIYQYINHNQLVLTSTNSGVVLYVSLGELIDNKWGRIKKDEVAFHFANEKGVNDPVGIEGKKVLTEQFIEDVRMYPYEYLRKIGQNTISIFTKGLYVTEFRNLITKGDEVKEVQMEELAKYYRLNKKELIKDLVKFKSEAICLLLFSGFQRLSILFLPLILIYSIYKMFKSPEKDLLFPYALILCVQIAICIFISCEPRHMSTVLPLFLFISLPSSRISDGHSLRALSQEDSLL